MTKKNIAAEFAPGSKMVQLVDKGTVVERTEAEALGYTVSASIAPAAPVSSGHVASANGPGIERRSWRAAIIASPEAKGRDNATAELLVKHSPDTLSTDEARAFLRGLPTEQPEPKASKVTNTDIDPRAARISEINGSMAEFNRNRGFTTRRAETPSAHITIEPTKLKRLAELRMAALEAGNSASAEAKKLRYALQVHDQTGSPLATIFTQLGVDASKFAR